MPMHANTDRLVLLRGTRSGCLTQEQMSQLLRRLREEVELIFLADIIRSRSLVDILTSDNI
jgi:hypothetical protein